MENLDFILQTLFKMIYDTKELSIRQIAETSVALGAEITDMPVIVKELYRCGLVSWMAVEAIDQMDRANLSDFYQEVVHGGNYAGYPS